jgi:hypothetical protein
MEDVMSIKTAFLAACVVCAGAAHAAEGNRAGDGKPELARDWVAMDVDRDGHITPDEMLNYEKRKKEKSAQNTRK